MINNGFNGFKVVLISSEPPFKKGGMHDLQRYPWNPFLFNNVVDIVFFCSKMWQILWFSSLKVFEMRNHFSRETTFEKNHFKNYKHGYLIFA